MIKSFYESLRSIDIPEDKAIEATEKMNESFEVLKEQQRIQASRVEFVKWAVAFVALIVAGVVIRGIFQ